MRVVTDPRSAKIVVDPCQPLGCVLTVDARILEYAPALYRKRGSKIRRFLPGIPNDLIGEARECGSLANAPRQFHHRMHQPGTIIVFGEIHQMSVTHECRMDLVLMGLTCWTHGGFAGAHKPPFGVGGGCRFQSHRIEFAGLRLPDPAGASLAAAGG